MLEAINGLSGWAWSAENSRKAPKRKKAPKGLFSFAYKALLSFEA
ncbi:hypothetical protein [Pseudomonas sp. COR18]